MDTTFIRPWSVQEVLEGVVVAAQASAELQESLLDWLLLQDDDDPDQGTSVRKILEDFLEEQDSPDTDEARLFKVTLAVCILRQASHANRELSAEDLDETWQLLCDAFNPSTTTKLKYKVSRGAPGYLAIPLCSLLAGGKIDELLRLHVWLPDGIRVKQEVAIHAHQTFAQSWIVAGQMTNHKYQAEPTTNDLLATNAEFAPRWDDGKYAGTSYKTFQRSSSAKNTNKLFIVTPQGSNKHTRNNTYTMSAGTHHWPSTAGTQLCSTLFYFDSRHGDFVQDAPVMGPKNGTENVQKRDPGAFTPSGLVQMVDAVRNWEKTKDIERSGEAEDEIVMAYYRLFAGREHLKLAQDPQQTDWAPFNREAAFDLFNSGSCPPMVAFCKEPSALHRRYLRELIDLGADMNADATDNHGCTALDYCLRNEDMVTEALILEALRSNQGQQNIDRLVYEAQVRKAYQEVFVMKLKPLLRRQDENVLSQMRLTYSDILANDSAMKAMFQPLTYVRYADFVEAVRLPRFSDGTLQTYPANSKDVDVKHILYLAYRWIHKHPISGKTANDDVDHTQFRRMLRALEDYFHVRPEIERDHVGIWLDSACVDRKNPKPGIAALPINLAQCDVLITVEDEHFWERAWCSIEALMMQILRRSFNVHKWYRYAPEGGMDDGLWTLEEASLDTDIDMASKTMTWEEDRGKISFLERQARLLSL